MLQVKEEKQKNLFYPLCILSSLSGKEHWKYFLEY